ncbi:MAG: hypothetical protein ABIL37_00035 [candidate division WOR-3 bacterium]
MKSLSEKLLILQDIEMKLLEIKSKEYIEKTGFEIDESKILEIEEYKKKLESEIPPQYLRRFKALFSRYNRAVAIVYDNACSNCFSRLPTGIKKPSDNELVSCNVCGVFLYFP